MEDKDTYFKKIVKETEPLIRAYIAGMGVQLFEVDDLSQEVFLAFYNDLYRMPKEVLPIKWLKGIAKNIALEHFRKNKNRFSKEKLHLAEILNKYAGFGETMEEHTYKEERLTHCMEKLNEESKNIINLRYYLDLDTKEISVKTGKSDDAIRVLLFRLRKILKDCISGVQTEKG